MKIKMLTVAAGPDGVWPAGSVQDVSAKVAKPLIDGGFAVKVAVPANGVWPAGSVQDVSAKVAKPLIDGGFAVKVAVPAKVTPAAAKKSEGSDGDEKPEGTGGDGDES